MRLLAILGGLVAGIITMVLPYELYRDTVNRIYYTFGSAINVTFIYSFVVGTALFAILILRRKEISRKKTIPIWMFLILASIAGITQVVHPELVITAAAESLVCCFMYFTIENPDVQLLEELYKNKKLIERTNEDTSNFLFRMTQDIKKPVKDMVELSKDMMSENDKSKLLDDVKIINNAALQIDYLVNDGKYYKYNYEINNIYYCPDNVIIDNFEVKKFNSDSFLIIDYFVLDLEKKKMYLYDKSISDDFEEKVKEISDIDVYKHEDSKNVLIRLDSGEYMALLLDKFNNLKGLESNIDSVLGNDFLGYDETIESLILPNIEAVGDEFLYYNTNLKYYDFRNLRFAGKKFLYNNLEIKDVFLPSLENADDEFMYFSKFIEKVYMPKLKETGKYFMYSAEQIEKFDLDLLERTSDYFLYNSNLQKEAYFPNLAEMGNYFMYSDDNVEILDAPNLREVGNFCFYKNLVLRNIISDNIESVGYGCNKEFEGIDRRKVLRK